MSKQNPGVKSDLQKILDSFRNAAVTEREKGMYFEELCQRYFCHEPQYRELYDGQVWLFADWAKKFGAEYGFTSQDVGIDLVARVAKSGEFHAIQCKFYAPFHKVEKRDIDSFFTASGKRPFTHRIIVASTNNWSEHAENALIGQNPPVTKIDLYRLEDSQIDWSRFAPDKKKVVLKEKKKLRPHQEKAIQDVLAGFRQHDRGKLFMACGTGKTFTALKLAERYAGAGGAVLFLVPSLALVEQTLREWTQHSDLPLRPYAVCSDSEIGKTRRGREDERVDTFAHELSYPATTNAIALAREFTQRDDSKHLHVIFSTYHSIEVVSQAQKKHGLKKFDLIICDEAHRTTGHTFEGEDESHFVKVHDDRFLRADKRLYMTATPRVYGEKAKAQAEEEAITICSMDDEKLFGPIFHTLTFSEAVAQDLLVDYKVLVLGVSESLINRRLQRLLAQEGNELHVDDAALMVGCFKALAKYGVEMPDDAEPMRRAVVFCQRIEYSQDNRVLSSKTFARMFAEVVEEYRKEDKEFQELVCEADHVDGSMNATAKEEKLHWLKEDAGPNTVRILSNVRCLSEGVDVPALDAVIFLGPRKSQMDVVQAVGRVMRRAPGKKRGYVILPVVIPPGREPEQILGDHARFKKVWQVLNALRSHDDRFDAMVNKMELVGPDKSKLEFVGVGLGKNMEVVSVTQEIVRIDSKGKGGKKRGATLTLGPAQTDTAEGPQMEIQFAPGDFERALYARIVKKVGNRRHWEEWAHDIGEIANTHVDRLQAILENKNNTEERKAFENFAQELRDDLNEQVSNQEIIEMLAQHLITKPVFDALFANYSFAKENPVSRALDKVLKTLEKHHIEKERDTLEKFYASVRLRAAGIHTAEGKQKIVLELYDKFFRGAFPKLTERLGIVYTPVEVVDFILRSVDELLQSEFGLSLGAKNVHIIDPFVGTGTFITRLIQSGLIRREDLPYKYLNEIHANELVLLAYYLAAINIEEAYYSVVSQGGSLDVAYTPFPGICFTDTFQLYEKDDEIAKLLADNSDRRMRQKKLDIRVIIGNPPYSAGQKSANDNNQNVKYPKLDSRIAETYAAESKANLQNKLYDSYVRAIRWASDRIGNAGVIGFITNAGWVEGNAMDGLRKCLAEEFSKIYVFHLRGNARTNGEQRRKEKDNVFGQGTRTPIAMTFLVKQPNKRGAAEINFHDIGDYLSREEKLEKIRNFASIGGITQANGWQRIVPDKYHDWLNQRDDSFNEFLPLGDKKKNTSLVFFENYSAGIVTSRDAWVYNFSRKVLEKNMRATINFYNGELARWQKNKSKGDVAWSVNTDATKISWSVNLRQDLLRQRQAVYQKTYTRTALYRPFTKVHLYFDPQWIERTLQIPKIFPTAEAENRVICVTGLGTTKEFSVLMANVTPDIQLLANGQCFPLYLYEDAEAARAKNTLFSETAPQGLVRRSAINPQVVSHFQNFYAAQNRDSSHKISAEDIFYYVYGLLHSSDYRQKYADNLSKELPRIPCVQALSDFWAFATAGRELGNLHVHYEKARRYGLKYVTRQQLEDRHLRVTKMKYNADKTAIVYNEFLTLEGIPTEAHEYVVNGKSALDWIVERYAVKTDKASGIMNDANAWALGTANNPRYIVELIERVTTVSVETVKIVKALPSLVV